MLKTFLSRVRGEQKGFTLIEMVVVVGIIAVLAAAIIPNIGRFVGSGEQGAKDSEASSVQNAMSAMMAEQVIDTMDAWDAPSVSTNLWNDKPTGTDAVPLYQVDQRYLRDDSTVYYYCYNAEGVLTQQDEAPTACP